MLAGVFIRGDVNLKVSLKVSMQAIRSDLQVTNSFRSDKQCDYESFCVSFL